MQKLVIGKNDMPSIHPELLEEWDYDNNSMYDPDKMFVNGSQIINWICKKGHKWSAYINNRTRNNKPQGCIFCSGAKAFPGETDFVTTNPEIACDWDYEKNTIDPATIKAGCDSEVYWKCHKCGNEWTTKVSAKTQGRYKCKQCRK